MGPSLRVLQTIRQTGKDGPVWDRPLRKERNRFDICSAVGAGVLTRPPWQFPRLFVGAHSVRPRAAEVVGPYTDVGGHVAGEGLTPARVQAGNATIQE